ncbi:hypothetical protein [Variovorax saccharolyticus]|uniref:hypothetical protein n=1 Tax=Variovorax saccharolyticus TaxID=3053516 RepID=UPI0025774C4C|nr:hypothetical protein [Variovorax sp. J31P216]MDM0028299.1 hypothetical protein [Variovorax sp. J31P216]
MARSSRPALFNDWEAPKDSVDRQGVAAYRRLLLRPEDNRAIAASARFRGDVLVVESEFDDTVPHAVIANYLAAFGNARTLTHRVLSGADHELSQDDWQQANAMLIQSWLTDQALRSLDA